MSAFINYIKEVKGEMKNITWPTRRQAIYATITVLAISVFIAYYLGFFDFVFSKGLSLLLTK